MTIATETPLFIVIGGGWSGLYALKYLLAEGLQARLYERESFLGGIWSYKETNGGVFRSTHTTSSVTFMHASDFTFPPDVGHFPSHENIRTFLENYVDHFDLAPHMHFTHQVLSVRRASSPSPTVKWVIRLQCGDREFQEYCQGVVICSGQHQTPADPRANEPFSHFTGTMSHSFEYKYPLPEHHNKTILVVGGGETASDIAVELSAVAKRVYMSIRQGQWFQGRLVGDQPADLTLTMLMRLPTYYDSYFVRMGARIFVEPVWGKGGTGIPEWQPQCNFMHGFLNKSREVVDKIGLGVVIPKRAITGIEGRMVSFERVKKSSHNRRRHVDDEEQSLTEQARSDTIHIDHILFCTGYRWNHPFLDDDLATETSVLRLYQLMFPVNLSGLAFVGSARPVFGSIPSIAELQARRVAQVFAGRAQIPTQIEMQRALTAYWKRHARLYPFDKRMKQLVNQFEYCDTLADELKIRPSLWYLFFRHPHKWYKIYCASPWTPFLFRLGKISNDEEKLAYKRHISCIPRSNQTFHKFNRPFVCTCCTTLLLIFFALLTVIFLLIFKFVFQ
jgi:dimethylaniline monooxygenase (N-oxide forming)